MSITKTNHQCVSTIIRNFKTQKVFIGPFVVFISKTLLKFSSLSEPNDFFGFLLFHSLNLHCIWASQSWPLKYSQKKRSKGKTTIDRKPKNIVITDDSSSPSFFLSISNTLSSIHICNLHWKFYTLNKTPKQSLHVIKTKEFIDIKCNYKHRINLSTIEDN